MKIDYSVLSESSISSLFLTPLRDSLSLQKESLPVDSFLKNNKEFLSGSVVDRLKRAEFVGIEGLFVQTPALKDKLSLSGLAPEKKFGEWSYFKLLDPQERIMGLSYEPVLFFGTTKFKNRWEDRLGFVRFQEEIFRKGKFDVIMADSGLDFGDSSKLENFKIALVTDYNFKNQSKAFEVFDMFSRKNSLLLIKDESSDLYKKLANLKSNKVFIFEKNITKTEDLSNNTLESQIIDFLDEKKIPIKTPAKVNSFSFENKEITVNFGVQNFEKKPILVKSSFFPAWQNTNGERVYLATPTFMLTFTRSDFNLKFKTPSVVYWGYLFSGVGILLVFFFLKKEGIFSNWY